MDMNNMQLPSVNAKEDLETISSNKFKLLFDVARFEIRPEEHRDKGIDFTLEAKMNGSYINFRSVVQLKATSSISANTDGSYSLQVETSNLNYLLNSGLPAFYVLYVETIDFFYYEDLREFIKDLSERNSDWQLQVTNVLRFSKPLNANAIDNWYHTIVKNGQFQRQIHERMAVRNAAVSADDKISFDLNLNITDDSEIRDTIENYGFLLDTLGRWTEIIKMHGQATGAVANTAKYNLILGIANYHTGNLFESMSFFKNATKLKAELTPLLQNHLLFFDITARYSVGMLTEENYLLKMSELENHPSIGLYVKLDKAKRAYLISEEMFSETRYNNFQQDVNAIISDPSASKSIILEAKCELALYEGHVNNINYVRDISGLNALEDNFGSDLDLRISHAQSFNDKFTEWHRNVQKLTVEAFESKNYFTCYHAMLNEVKITYEFCVFRKAIQLQREANGFPKEQMYNQVEVFNPLIKMLEEAHKYYDSIDHVLNKAAALAQKYEIMHFIGDMSDAQKILSELENLINQYDLIELKERFEYLKSEGPTHTRFDALLSEIFEKRRQYNETSKKQADEIAEMDRNDSQAIKLKDNCYLIELFPMGYYQFPPEKLPQVFEILNINLDSTKKQFENILNNQAVPIANLYNNPITREGPLNSYAANKGLDGWANLYRVRKAFYESKFYKIEYGVL